MSRLGIVERRAIEALIDEAKDQAEQAQEALASAKRAGTGIFASEAIADLLVAGAANNVRMMLLTRAVELLLEAAS